jgi:hypothetical protein
MPPNTLNFLDTCRRNACLLDFVKDIAFGDERAVRAAALANVATMHKLNLTGAEAKELLEGFFAPMAGSPKAKVVALLAHDQAKLDELLQLEKTHGNRHDLFTAVLARLRDWGIDGLTLEDIADIYVPIGDPDDPDGPIRGS